MKVKFFDKGIRNQFWVLFSVLSGILSFVLLFNIVPDSYKEYLKCFGYITFALLILMYIYLWYRANNLTDVKIDIEGSTVNIKSGDLFNENGFKVIPFNEYFDTIVDEKIIASSSLNGIYINKYLDTTVQDLDNHIIQNSDNEDIIDNNSTRRAGGKSIKHKISTIIVYKDFLLTAFAKFDDHNKAVLTMPEYLEFLINFWDRVNRVYAQRSVSVPIFGSGITRIKEHKNISDEDLLKIMIWTFKLSEMKFKYPAKLSIIVHKDKIKNIDLFNLKSTELGL
ncbi:macro domain-containing protein [Soonwooa sp.]|uniref:macro domain-containing protein n=1 Tax=Soonwooa sp. TaxID=1938592 RepID=UPI0028A25C87|nr:macro domain-containing protein [Soonwooa sp.]